MAFSLRKEWLDFNLYLPKQDISFVHAYMEKENSGLALELERNECKQKPSNQGTS